MSRSAFSIHCPLSLTYSDTLPIDMSHHHSQLAGSVADSRDSIQIERKSYPSRSSDLLHAPLHSGSMKYKSFGSLWSRIAGSLRHPAATLMTAIIVALFSMGIGAFYAYQGDV